MRCFLGIGLPPGPREVLAHVLDRMRKTGAPVRWVRPENLHVTLKFLGELGDEHLENLKVRLGKVEKPPLELALEGLGTFPSRGHPRVLWAGVRDLSGNLKRLAAEVGRAAVRVGVPREDRPFHGHITLGRMKGGVGAAAVRSALEELAPEMHCDPFTAEHFTLFESTLSPGGSIYRRLQDY